MRSRSQACTKLATDEFWLTADMALPCSVEGVSPYAANNEGASTHSLRPGACSSKVA